MCTVCVESAHISGLISTCFQDSSYHNGYVHGGTYIESEFNIFNEYQNLIINIMDEIGIIILLNYLMKFQLA